MTNPPNRLWLQPGEVWSIWDMIALTLGELMEASNSVTMISQALMSAEEMGRNPRGYLAINIFVQLRDSALVIERVAKEVDLDATEAAARRLVDMMDRLEERHHEGGGTLNLPDNELMELKQLIVCLKQAFADQAASRFALVLSKAERNLFESTEPRFGGDVFAKFNDAARDFEEAAKCLALHRNTACVFHLMLAMERVLRVLAGRIGADLLNRNGKVEKWSVLVGRMKDKIPLQPPDKQDEWTAAHNLLWGVGKVWRNDTMHPADAYTDGEAKEVYDAVGGFARRLSELV